MAIEPSASRAYFALCSWLGRALRGVRYTVVSGRSAAGPTLSKRRRRFAPGLIRAAAPGLRLLGTGVRVLSQERWAAAEEAAYSVLYGQRVTLLSDHRTIVVPRLPGAPLAVLLSDAVSEPRQRRALALAAAALARLHAELRTHGDATAANVLIDEAGDVARWIDFEMEHDERCPASWCRADDVATLLVSALADAEHEQVAPRLAIALEAYGDRSVVPLMAARFGSVWHRSLAFTLAKAPVSEERYRLLGVLLEALTGRSTGE